MGRMCPCLLFMHVDIPPLACLRIPVPAVPLDPQGERLSHAVGCAFAICLEKKQKRDKETGVTVTYSQDRTSFTRTGSFRQTTLTERIVDPQSAIVAGKGECVCVRMLIERLVNIQNNIVTNMSVCIFVTASVCYVYVCFHVCVYVCCSSTLSTHRIISWLI